MAACRALLAAAIVAAAGCGARTGLDTDDPGENGPPTIRQCPIGFAECDDDALPDCETDLMNGTESCGACGQQCDDGLACGHGRCVPPGQVVQLALGAHSTCARQAGGSAYCWGQSWEGEVGADIVAPFVAAPTKVVGLTSAAQLSGGIGSSCARRRNHTVVCWGRNLEEQLGTDDTKASPVPVDAYRLSDVAHVAAGSPACALRRSGIIDCWGDNYKNSLGAGREDPLDQWAIGEPVQVHGIEDATYVMRGCAIRSDGRVVCWGRNEEGLLGDGSYVNSAPTPVYVKDLSSATQIDGYWYNRCAVHDGGRVSCWGASIGRSPVETVGVTDAIEVKVGLYFACVRRTSGQVACWGDISNADPQLLGWGIALLGHYITSPPVDVPGLDHADDLDVGQAHACALQDGKVYCWGSNEWAELGDGTLVDSAVPVDVVGLPP